MVNREAARKHTGNDAVHGKEPQGKDEPQSGFQSNPPPIPQITVWMKTIEPTPAHAYRRIPRKILPARLPFAATIEYSTGGFAVAETAAASDHPTKIAISII